jgi:uncharacterized protein
MVNPDYQGAIDYAISQLKEKLPSDLIYHSVDHTACDILPAVERLAGISQVVGDDLQLLRVGAAYHDIGFIYRYQGHELASARLAAQILPDFGFNDELIERILGMIMATRLPQSPRNLLEELLVDADLDILGRNDFFKGSLKLRFELALYGRPTNEKQWYQEQLNFLKGHFYFSDAAKSIRDAGKQKNTTLMEWLIQKDGQ